MELHFIAFHEAASRAAVQRISDGAVRVVHEHTIPFNCAVSLSAVNGNALLQHAASKRYSIPGHHAVALSAIHGVIHSAAGQGHGVVRDGAATLPAVYGAAHGAAADGHRIAGHDAASRAAVYRMDVVCVHRTAINFHAVPRRIAVRIVPAINVPGHICTGAKGYCIVPHSQSWSVNNQPAVKASFCRDRAVCDGRRIARHRPVGRPAARQPAFQLEALRVVYRHRVARDGARVPFAADELVDAPVGHVCAGQTDNIPRDGAAAAPTAVNAACAGLARAAHRAADTHQIVSGRAFENAPPARDGLQNRTAAHVHFISRHIAMQTVPAVDFRFRRIARHMNDLRARRHARAPRQSRAHERRCFPFPVAFH